MNTNKMETALKAISNLKIMRNRRVKNMNTNKRETALKAISNLKIKLQEAKTKK